VVAAMRLCACATLFSHLKVKHTTYSSSSRNIE
jgi:hypothetical protein